MYNRCATFTNITPNVHLGKIYRCHMVVCVNDLHFKLNEHGYGHIRIFYVFTKLTEIIIYVLARSNLDLPQSNIIDIHFLLVRWLK